MGVMIKLKNVRLVWPRIWVKTAFEGDPDSQPTYNASFLIDKKDPQVKTIAEAIFKVVSVKWPNNPKAMMQSLKVKNAICLKDGDVHQADREDFHGCYYLNAGSSKEFLRVSKDKKELTQDRDPFYGGCRVLAFIEIWPQDSKKAKRVNARLAGIQFIGDDKPIDSTPNPTISDFEFFEADTSQDINSEDLNSFLGDDQGASVQQTQQQPIQQTQQQPVQQTQNTQSYMEDDLPF